MKKYLRDYLFLFSISGLIILIDQWTKALIRAQLQFGQIWVPAEWIDRYARLVHWRNTGAAFGMFQNLSGVFTLLAILVSIAIIYYFPRLPSEDKLLRLALALQLGGAVGNLIDRLTLGYVTDFVSVLNFPVFNVADASISAGVVLLVIIMWNREQEKYDQEKEDEQSQEPGPPSTPDPMSSSIPPEEFS